MCFSAFPRNISCHVANHLLGNAGWVRARLIPFAGKQFTLNLSLPPPEKQDARSIHSFRSLRSLHFVVTPEGFLCSCDEETTADATITLPEGALTRFFTRLLTRPPLNKDQIFQEVTVSGNAVFAETLGFIFRHLEWDVAGDLAPLTGDILARRLTQCGKTLLKEGVPRLAPLLPHAQTLFGKLRTTLREQVGAWGVPAEKWQTLREDTQTLIARISALEDNLNASYTSYSP